MLRGPGRGSRERNRRRGVVMAEAGVVYSVTIILILGMIMVGLGVFRYQEVAYQARVAARWASLQSATPSSADVLAKITPMMLQKNLMTATVSKTTINSVNYVSVKLTYAWTPEGFPGVLSPVTFDSTSTQPTTQ